MDGGLIVDRSRSVVIFAAQSRAFVFILQFFFNYLIPDHNADVFKPESPKNLTLSNRIASNLFDGLTSRWDANYFMHIAEYGYTYENALVFFPLFPFLTKVLACTLLLPLQCLISYRNVLHCSAVILNFVSFLASACCFYKLGCKVLKQEHLAYRAAQLFCVNPASVFFSAAYSESIFSAFTFVGLLKLQEGSYLKASFCFAFSSATRSNGIINAGFIIYSYLLYWWKRWNVDSIDDFCTSKVTNHIAKFFTGALVFIWEVLSMFLWVFISCSLFLSHQAYSYLMYCGEMRNEFKVSIPKHVVEYGKLRDYNMPGYGPVPKWCHSKVPFSYSEIQGQHWNVGLFRYYEVNQLPNFLLALPLLVVSLSFCASYVKRRTRYCLRLGMISSTEKEKKVKANENLSEGDALVYYHQNECFVYMVQLAFLVIFGTLCMHIQVITRMVCSSCPAFYWYLAEKCLSKDERMAIKIASQKDFGRLSGGKKIDKRLKENLKGTVSEHSGYGKQETEVKNRKSFANSDVRSRINSTKSSDAFEHVSENLDDRIEIVMAIFNDSEVIDWNEGLYNRVISVYFHLYLFVGVAAFSNFFPWT